MRTAPLSLLTLFVACATQQAPPQLAAAGMNRSIFPVHVIDERTSTEHQLGKRRVTTAEYKSCAGVYVTPHLIVTSSTALPFPDDDSSFVNVGDVKIIDGFRSLTVKDVPFFDHLTGVTLIRVEEEGTPIGLAVGQARNARHEAIGLAFTPRAMRTGFAESSWETGTVKIVGLTRGYGALHYSAEVEMPPGMCGAVVLDKSHRLVGLLHGRTGNRAILIPASAIESALREAGVR